MSFLALSDGGKIFYEHHVCDAPGTPTILFVHGFPLDHSMWQGQLPLVDHASLLLVDLPGFGRSPLPAGEVTMQSFAANLAELVRQLEIPQVIFCGLSMGGYIGWEFAAGDADLLAGLICCNTRASADEELVARGRRVAAADVMKNGTEAIADAMREKLFSSSTQVRDGDLVRRVWQTIRDSDPETVAAGQLAMADRLDHHGRLQEIDCRVLVVAGSDDVITPAEGMRQMSLEFADGSFVELAQSGHLSPAEQPALFNRSVLDWL